jgi:hypothetical protein
VRLAKRKDYSGSDLVQQKYATGVKRQRLADGRVGQLCDFVAAACPTKSGERSVSYHQYTTDASLYSAYRTSVAAPPSVVQDCIIVLEYISNGHRMRENIDFLCDCAETNKNDYRGSQQCSQHSLHAFKERHCPLLHTQRCDSSIPLFTLTLSLCLYRC